MPRPAADVAREILAALADCRCPLPPEVRDFDQAERWLAGHLAALAAPLSARSPAHCSPAFHEAWWRTMGDRERAQQGPAC